MKIILDSEPSAYGGDVVAIDRLLTTLEAYRNSRPYLASPSVCSTLDQWISYLGGVVNRLTDTKRFATGPQLEFTLPFDRDALRGLQMEERLRKHSVRRVE